MVADASKPLGPELAEAVRALGEIRRETEHRLEGVEETALNARPDPDRWSAGEVLLHLTEVNRRYADRMEKAIERARKRGRLASGPFRYGPVSRRFAAMLAPPVKRRLKAPAVFRPPVRTATAADLSEYYVGLARLERLARESDGVDLTVLVTSPVPILRFSLGSCFRILVNHQWRHLEQIRGVLEHPALGSNRRGHPTEGE